MWPVLGVVGVTMSIGYASQELSETRTREYKTIVELYLELNLVVKG